MIDQSRIDRIKDYWDGASVADLIDLPYDPKTKRYCCPKHHDSHPSATAKDYGLMCWAGCGAIDVIEMVELVKGYRFHEAVQFLEQEAGFSQEVLMPKKTCPLNEEELHVIGLNNSKPGMMVKKSQTDSAKERGTYIKKSSEEGEDAPRFDIYEPVRMRISDLYSDNPEATKKMMHDHAIESVCYYTSEMLEAEDDMIKQFFREQVKKTYKIMEKLQNA
ncbi:MAG: hypothetical protein K6G62_00815 [Eubacterium sp.]|nr:hypothetical protein [Eubacterium sp.]